MAIAIGSKSSDVESLVMAIPSIITPDEQYDIIYLNAPKISVLSIVVPNENNFLNSCRVANLSWI